MREIFTKSIKPPQEHTGASPLKSLFLGRRKFSPESGREILQVLTNDFTTREVILAPQLVKKLKRIETRSLIEGGLAAVAACDTFAEPKHAIASFMVATIMGTIAMLELARRQKITKQEVRRAINKS